MTIPGIRPLETLHNALSLRQLDSFLGFVTGASFWSAEEDDEDAGGGGGGGSSGGGDSNPKQPKTPHDISTTEVAAAAAAATAAAAAAAAAGGAAASENPTSHAIDRDRRPTPLLLDFISRENSECAIRHSMNLKGGDLL